MSARDRYVLGVVAIFGVLGAFWLLALSPKREKSAKLDKDIATAEQALQQAKQEKVQFARAQVQFAGLFADLGRLGKAVPADEDVPSLLVQLNHAANTAAIRFHSIELKVDKDAEANAATAAAGATAPPGGATATAGAAGASAWAAGAPAAGSPAASPAAAGAASAPSASSGAAGATATASTIQPLPFEYKFKGGFFSLKHMIREMQDLIVTKNRELAISGRLLTIQGFSLKRGAVTILANSYLLPPGEPLFAGATPQGPAGVDPTQPQPASSPSTTTPPSAAVTAP